jgi:hypothetical protein
VKNKGEKIMATQTKVSNSSQLFHGRIVKPNINISMVVFAILMAILAASLIMAKTHAANNLSNHQRVLLAESARYNGLAKIYLGTDEFNKQRAINAESARYTGSAELYLAKDASNRQRAMAADAARYTGLAELFLKKEESNRQREYLLGERYGEVLPQGYSQQQALREYWLGERYGQTP